MLDLSVVSDRLKKVDSNYFMRRIAIRKLLGQLKKIRPSLQDKLLSSASSDVVINAAEGLIDAVIDSIDSVQREASTRGIIQVIKDNTLRDEIDRRWTVDNDLQMKAFELFADSNIAKQIEDTLIDVII
jgi:hypothetical protein